LTIEKEIKSKYSDIYVTSNDEDDDISRTSDNKTNTTEDRSNYHNKKVPTLQNEAKKLQSLRMHSWMKNST
jgi:hypothetical protein